MGKFKLIFRHSVARDLRRIPNKDVRLILQRIDQIAENPRGPECDKLTDQERYRVRQGNYRIIYEIQNDLLIIVVVKIGHRREIYRKS
jgi:mRNA interferase RelE/StbE